MPAALPTGLLILHGNRLERLAETVFAWLARHPLDALEEEFFLVQSNGMAEWLKMQLAEAHGICAATRVELPARFVWRAYRAVLGRQAVPTASALDKLPLTWRLMGLLPALAGEPRFAPVAAFLGPEGDAARRLQLARRLADLFDQYQVYRGQWLHDWAAGHDRLRPHEGLALARAPAVPAEQAWQPALWRALLAGLSPAEQQVARPALHRRFLQALAMDDTGAAPGHAAPLPRRVVLFGTTHMPHQTLEAIAALQSRCQVLLAVPNPCRYHWADTIDGRELLALQRRRLPLRGGRDLAAVPLEAMHLHGHPLLAAWGRQARDFVRQLDAFDDVQQARQRFALDRLDLFEAPPGRTLLAQLQTQILDLVPAAEPAAQPLPADDRSIVFHIAHSAQREVEVLHDQLLHLLAHPPEGRPLAPRDIVVMVPDIDGFAAPVRAVFGQYPRGHARHIPWGLADQRLRGHQPLLLALDWLLQAPRQRFALGQLRELLDVPAVARRLGLAADELPALLHWAAGAGVRWGLHTAHREALDLGDCGEANTWQFGLERMLLGWATGTPDPARADDDGFQGIEPYAEVAGLAAAGAGALAEWIARLSQWWADARAPRPPAAWAERLRALLASQFEASDETEQALLAALDDALGRWLEACERAGFDAPLPLDVVREAWLDALDAPEGASRFRAGGVTFCTLLPLRAIPFEVVCLLGMNDGDYPRQGLRNDFDLMALPGQALPGDRSRRDDDRQLMLDALLSARRVLYISWAGRSPRDNQAQPPSVLVGQLRDHLAAGWGATALAARTTEHPLQPFSRRYFEAGSGDAADLFTYAAEWRAAHADASPAEAARAATARSPADLSGDARAAGPRPDAIDGLAFELSDLGAMLRNPVRAFFQHRLRVRFDDLDEPELDDEPFALAGLERWALLDDALRDTRPGLAAALREAAAGADDHARATALAGQALARLRRAGRLPLGGPGEHWHGLLLQTLAPMLAQWLRLARRHAQPLPPLAVAQAIPAADGQPPARLQDQLSGARAAIVGDTAGGGGWLIECCPGALLQNTPKAAKPPRAERLVGAWLRGLASTAAGRPLGTWLIGTDTCLRAEPPALDAADAAATLQSLLQAAVRTWQGPSPWPTALATGLAWLAGGSGPARLSYEGSSFGGPRAEGAEPCLARLYPDFEHLANTPDFAEACTGLYAPMRTWLHEAVQPVPLPDAQPLDEGDGAPAPTAASTGAHTDG